jgi:hypothetical protein
MIPAPPRRRASQALAFAFCVVIAGCAPVVVSESPLAQLSSGPATSPISSTSQASTAVPSFPDASNPQQEATPSEVAWGSIQTTRLPIGVEADRYFVFSGSGTPDGRFLIGDVIRNHFLDTTSRRPGDVVLYEVASRKIQKLATMQAPNSQVTSASADEDWVVWMEADDADAYNWQLFAANRATGKVHQVAKADTKDGNPVPGPLTFVWVSHGSVVWGQGADTGISQGSVGNAVVRRHDLASGTTTTIAKGAGNPTLSWPWVAWEEFPAEAAARTVVANLDTGWTGALDVAPPSIVLDGQSAAYSTKDLHSIWLLDDVMAPSSATEIARGANVADYLQWPSLNERIVGWVQDDVSVVFDRAEHRLVRLPIAQGWSWGTVAGPNLVWFETDPTHTATDHPDWAVVADTRSFPVVP